MTSVASVDMRNGHTRSRGLRTESASAPSCLKTAVDITSFLVRWMDPAAKGVCRWGSGIFGALCRIMVPTTFNTGKRESTIAFIMPVSLALGALYNRSFPPWRFDGNLHVA